jgi:alpha-tubulin suppressor-like RCC1 family protein
MATVNESELLSKLRTMVAQLDVAGSANVEAILTTTLASKVLLDTNIITVATIDDLPDLGEFDLDGMIYFVTSINVFAVSSTGKWITLDVRLLRTDYSSELLAWGRGDLGRLGDNTTTDRSSPVSVVGGFTDWCQVSAGNVHGLGVRINGSAWAWGLGTCGQLGDDTTTNRSSPVSVVGGFTDWYRVSGGGVHSLGVRTNGTAWAWGANGSGQLGDNTTTDRSSPVSVVGGFTDWCQVSGANHSLGVRTNGSAWAWGNNCDGQLGDNTTTDRSSPVSVVGGFTNWCQVSVGYNHSLGVRTNGTAWAWGCNGNGRLGDNTTTNSSSPVSVVGGFTDWCQLAGGNGQSLGVRINGSAWAWGCNGNGRLGDNTVTDRSSPVSVVGGFTDWCQLAGGNGQSLGVRINGTAWAWGRDDFGQLGDNTTTDRSSPVSVVGGFTDWCQVSAGNVHSLGIKRI